MTPSSVAGRADAVVRLDDMASVIHSFDPPERFVAGTVGPPGVFVDPEEHYDPHEFFEEGGFGVRSYDLDRRLLRTACGAPARG